MCHYSVKVFVFLSQLSYKLYSLIVEWNILFCWRLLRLVSWVLEKVIKTSINVEIRL